MPVLESALNRHGLTKVVAHFHDTDGQGLANVLQAWRAGIMAFDASTGGLGGCPYSPGTTGNVAIEDLVYMFEGLGFQPVWIWTRFLTSREKFTRACIETPAVH